MAASTSGAGYSLGAPGSGTRLDLVHSNWERLGEKARIARRGYPIGWSYDLIGRLAMALGRLRRAS